LLRDVGFDQVDVLGLTSPWSIEASLGLRRLWYSQSGRAVVRAG
jgi:hypothetical protein